MPAVRARYAQSGGEKLSAVDIERALLELDYITDAAVMGIPNEDWGQVVSLPSISSVAKQLGLTVSRS